MRKKLFTTFAAVALLASGARAGFAFGGGHGHHMGGAGPFMGGGGTLPLPVLISVMTTAQRDQLVQHALATTLKVRAMLSPSQLAEAATKVQRLHDLRTEMRGLLGPSLTGDDSPD